MLRLPTGIFYAGGVKSNVLFFDNRPASRDGKPWTDKIWIYDLRTNIHFTQKENKMTRADLDDFVKCYNSENISQRKETTRFKPFSYDEIMEGDKYSLDIFWLKDKTFDDLENLPEPEILADEILDNLKFALDSVNKLIVDLKSK